MIAAGVLDTSVFIANETGRPLDESAVPGEVATTVITLGELNAGVLAAGSADVRARRLATLDAVADIVALPVDEEAARVWARLRVHLAEAGRRMGVNDLWIAAIAVSRGLPVVTQDDDFTALEGAAGFIAIRV
ncbi:type II toxin-antitoxin system VapC family toxin [Mycolicibacterium sp.]|uniref:type II toxin-antitoxin system VapC family toxin n=1 Tax=Mycolicibacterium sp. TaxID=2320850 RepID=UPI0025FF7617|nr:type II toxin-antitoxin system VapC family toxin [Mycolicibacterium sp.]MCB9410810.1 type II toxin-antitoxin system VapC family toxin [Mycolicibacterium sp.]